MTSPQEAARYLLALQDAETSYLGFLKLRYPNFTFADFQLELIDVLDRLEKRTLVNEQGKQVLNLLITMPPRHAKSTYATINFPAYYMGRDPARFTMSVSYNATLAADFGRQVRDIGEDELTSQIFPNFRIPSDSRAADVWRTDIGGAYFGIGISGTTTGRPANLLIIDDPIKSREEAESVTMRNKVWEFYLGSLTSRLQPETTTGLPYIRIVILTRWHPDDLAGRLMKTQEWKDGEWMHLNYPAIITEKGRKISRRNLPPDHPMYIGEPNVLSRLSKYKRFVHEEVERALWPSRFPLENLQKLRRLNRRNFESLYQQKPFIEGGNILKTEWWQYPPDDWTPDNFQSIIIAADTAFKSKEQNDFSVLLVAGLTHDGDIFVLDVHRGRWEYPELRQRLITLNNLYRGRGLRGIYVEDKASGQSLIQDLKRESGLAVIPYKIHNNADKVSRANAVTPLIQGGRVFLRRGAQWLDEFVNETSAFPNGTHDDQVDALTMALDVLSKQSISPESMFGGMDAIGSLNQQMRANPRQHMPLGQAPRFRNWGEL